MTNSNSPNGDTIGTFEPDGRSGGYLRSAKHNYAQKPGDPRVSPEICDRYRLRGGESVSGVLDRKGGRKAQRPSLSRATAIQDRTPDDWIETTPFDELTVIDPRRRARFETPDGPMSMRIIDLMAPVGFGQRALIVAPPRTGKTMLLQQMAHGLAVNHPEAYVMVLLIDERPEEVTEMRRSVHGEVVHSSNDHDIASHVRIAKLMIANGRRRLECGEDVVILLDSLTRLGRAFNAHTRGSGRIMSGGLDIRALAEPKVIFGAARNIEDGGSLTIVASALIETGSRMDDVIFNEFKGTGNMEIMLSSILSNKRLWPAIDLEQSGTRKEELLLDEKELAMSYKLRRELIGRPPDVVMESVIERMQRHNDNASFVKTA